MQRCLTQSHCPKYPFLSPARQTLQEMEDLDSLPTKYSLLEPQWCLLDSCSSSDFSQITYRIDYCILCFQNSSKFLYWGLAAGVSERGERAIFLRNLE